jgi:hypothetical protein
MMNQNEKFQDLIKMYNSVGLRTRNMNFLTKWFYDTYKFAHLSSIDEDLLEDLCIDKTKLSVFAILVDDLADNSLTRNQRLLEESINIPWNGTKKYHDPYLEAIRVIWNESIFSIQDYPRFEEFKDLFYFDLKQFLNSICYGSLVNSMEMANYVETKSHSYHNMMVLLFCDMDLMCSPDFDKDELGKLRPILHWVQDITHIGNILSTYRREIEEQDFSSPIISIALSEGVLDKDTVKNDPKKALENVEYIIPYFKKRAEENFQRIKDYSDTIYSVDIKDFYKQTKKAWNRYLQRPEYWKKYHKMEKEKIIASPEREIPDQVRWVRM